MPDSFYVFVDRKSTNVGGGRENKRENEKKKRRKDLGGIKFRTFIPSALWAQFSRVIKNK